MVAVTGPSVSSYSISPTNQPPCPNALQRMELGQPQNQSPAQPTVTNILREIDKTPQHPLALLVHRFDQGMRHPIARFSLVAIGNCSAVAILGNATFNKVIWNAIAKMSALGLSVVSFFYMQALYNSFQSSVNPKTIMGLNVFSCLTLLGLSFTAVVTKASNPAIIGQALCATLHVLTAMFIGAYAKPVTLHRDITNKASSSQIAALDKTHCLISHTSIEEIKKPVFIAGEPYIYEFKELKKWMDEHFTISTPNTPYPTIIYSNPAHRSDFKFRDLVKIDRSLLRDALASSTSNQQNTPPTRSAEV